MPALGSKAAPMVPRRHLFNYFVGERLQSWRHG